MTISRDFEKSHDLFLNLGFEEIFVKSIASHWSPQRERMSFFWREGILGKLESVNSGRSGTMTIWYNWEYSGKDDSYKSAVGAGHFNERMLVHGRRVWIGDHDGQENLPDKLAELALHGVFLEEWVERPFLWLLSHAENARDYRKINEDVINSFPIMVQVAITPANLVERTE